MSDSRRIPLATLASPENSKLGPWIHSWSLPAGKRETCPGETDLCRRACYAKKNSFAYPSVQTAYRRNKAMADKPWFADWMTAELKHRMVRIVRIHVSGDFYSVEYTRKWHTIVAACPDARFFAYTRSWAVDAMLHDLIQLSRFPNMALWWSVDRLSGPAPAIRGIRKAYMAIDDADAMNAPNDCDLIFRDRRSTRMKRGNGVLVCPHENGVKTQVRINCSKCGICWKTDKAPRWEAAYDEIAAELLAPPRKKRRGKRHAAQIRNRQTT